MEETPFTNPERHLSGVANAIAILELLAANSRPVALARIAQAMGMSKAGVHRAVSTLTAHGYVRRMEGGAYCLGLKLWQLGLAVPVAGIVQVAKPHMEALRDETQETVILSGLSGFDAVYLHHVASRQAVRVEVNTGDVNPANCSASGLLLLAYSTAEEIEAAWPQELPRTSSKSPCTRQAVIAEIRKIRKQEYAIGEGIWREDVRGVSVPVYDGVGEVIAALNVSAPQYRLTEQRLKVVLRQVRSCSKTITEQLRDSVGSARAA